jgi:predicted PurR-regulated permease PerM
MERQVQNFLPLQQRNLDNIWKETRTMVVSNAVGIPLLAILQGILAATGYAIFGVPEWGLWGVISGVLSIVPIVGTALIWIPLTAYLFATGHSGQAVGLLVYSIVIVTNSDNVLRFTLLRKLGDVHPIVTVLGLIAGVPIFGIMGFIFGPLLVSYLMLLVQIYRVEFSNSVADVGIDGQPPG